jgi:transposase
MAVEGATTSRVFETYYVERVLAPALRCGQVVVMDDLLGAHRPRRICRELIEERGCELIYLPRPTPRISTL